MKASIVAGGNFSLTDLIKDELSKSDLIVAADSGLDYLLKNNIRIDAIVGDFDSMSQEGKVYSKNNKENLLVFPKEKDFTDSFIAIRYALEKGSKLINMFGFTGTRLDHSLNNILLLKYIYNHGVEGKIIDTNNIIFLLEGNLLIDKKDLKDFKYISVLPTSSDIFLTTKGFKYDVESLKLNPNRYHGRGISNELKKPKASLEIEGSGGLVIYSKD